MKKNGDYRMKTNQIVRIIIPLVLLLGGATGFLVVALSNQHVDASTNAIQETNTYESDGYSMNMWISGFSGESEHTTRANSIDILAYSHSITSPDWQTIMRGAGSASAQHTPLRVTKMVDKATPKLFEKCTKGENILSVILCFYYEPVNKKYLNITLQSVMVVSIQDYGFHEGRPTETVSFAYDKIKWIYTEYDSGGFAKGNVEVEDTWTDA